MKYYNAKIILTYPADTMSEAEEELDGILDDLYDNGYESYVAALEEVDEDE